MLMQYLFITKQILVCYKQQPIRVTGVTEWLVIFLYRAIIYPQSLDKKRPQVIDYVKLEGNKAYRAEATGVTPGVTSFFVASFYKSLRLYWYSLNNKINVFISIFSFIIVTIFQMLYTILSVGMFYNFVHATFCLSWKHNQGEVSTTVNRNNHLLDLDRQSEVITRRSARSINREHLSITQNHIYYASVRQASQFTHQPRS